MADAIFTVLAIIVSIYAAITANKSAAASIRSSNCNAIFDEYLISKIPKARAVLRFDGSGYLRDGNVLCEVLSNMNVAALFYKYDDKDFFEKLTKKCSTLEDAIAEAGNYPRPSEHEQKKFWNEVQESLETIYKLIDQKRVGKKSYLFGIFN